MFRILVLLISTFIVGCSMSPTLPHAEKHRLARWNFKYRRDIDDEWLSFDDISRPFTGDCEDFAFTMQNEIGGKVHYTKLNEGGAHAVLIKDGVVYDNMKKSPYLVKEFQGSIFHEMIFTGTITQN